MWPHTSYMSTWLQESYDAPHCTNIAWLLSIRMLGHVNDINCMRYLWLLSCTYTLCIIVVPWAVEPIDGYARTQCSTWFQFSRPSIDSQQRYFIQLVVIPAVCPMKINFWTPFYRVVDSTSSSWTAFMMMGLTGRDNSNSSMVQQRLTHLWQMILSQCPTKSLPRHQFKWLPCLSSISRSQRWCNQIPSDHQCNRRWAWALQQTTLFWMLALGHSQWRTTGISNITHSVVPNFCKLLSYMRKFVPQQMRFLCDYISCIMLGHSCMRPLYYVLTFTTRGLPELPDPCCKEISDLCNTRYMSINSRTCYNFIENKRAVDQLIAYLIHAVWLITMCSVEDSQPRIGVC